MGGVTSLFIACGAAVIGETKSSSGTISLDWDCGCDRGASVIGATSSGENGCSLWNAPEVVLGVDPGPKPLTWLYED